VLTITRHEDGNFREREDKRGRVRVSKSIRIVWRVSGPDGVIEDCERLKEAKQKYPDAVYVRV